MENRYRRKTVWDVPTFYITHYIGCRFEHAEKIFAKKIQIHIKAIPNMILSANKLRLSGDKRTGILKNRRRRYNNNQCLHIDTTIRYMPALYLNLEIYAIESYRPVLYLELQIETINSYQPVLYLELHIGIINSYQSVLY